MPSANRRTHDGILLVNSLPRSVSPSATPKNMVWIPDGNFLMGSALADYPEEGPTHFATVSGFWMDDSPVTVAQFRRFVRATGYITVAERALAPDEYPQLNPSLLAPGSLVFQQSDGPVDLSNMLNWWRYLPGASWRSPQGPDDYPSGNQTHPVVHVCWEDVQAYGVWANKDLPTEAEWEFAARGGLEGALYTWGDDWMPRGRVMANTWVGEFPWQNLKQPGRQRTSPVRSFPSNGYGLFDMAGNVWEWTADYYRESRADEVGHACCAPVDLQVKTAKGSYDESEPGGAHVPRRVIKGGSHLCAPNYCRRYRPAARQAQQIESSMSHLGFRCIIRP